MKSAQTSEVESLPHPPQSPDESMCVALYAYGFGTIGFIDPLDRFEEAFNRKSPQVNYRNDSREKE